MTQSSPHGEAAEAVRLAGREARADGCNLIASSEFHRNDLVKGKDVCQAHKVKDFMWKKNAYLYLGWCSMTVDDCKYRVKIKQRCPLQKLVSFCRHSALWDV